MALMECVPNFSEGRDTAVIAALAAELASVSGAHLLDQSQDPSHHRCVFTLAGEPAAVAEAAVRAVGKAAELIDLTRHLGEHPRIGAADVVPFVPLHDISLEQCAAWAHWAGEQIWRRWRIPVYFYEAAAARPERRQLENIRRGGFEALLAGAWLDPNRRPDLGAAPHPAAGAVAVGARPLLIACNINLATADQAIARQIARAIRASSGGLPAVKALGLRLRDPDQAQVSMNLTDFRQTGLYDVWRRVSQLARDLGTAAVETELIGLIPRAALAAGDPAELRIHGWNPNMILEERLQKAGLHLPL